MSGHAFQAEVDILMPEPLLYMKNVYYCKKNYRFLYFAAMMFSCEIYSIWKIHI